MKNKYKPGIGMMKAPVSYSHWKEIGKEQKRNNLTRKYILPLVGALALSLAVYQGYNAFKKGKIIINPKNNIEKILE